MSAGSAAWNEQLIFRRMQSLMLPAIQEGRPPQVFEWGPGFSTLFFAVRKCRIVTVEHNEMWLKAQQNAIQGSGFRTIDLRYRPPVVRSGASLQCDFDPSDPWQYSSKDHKGFDFHSYVAEIHAFPRKYDIIYIDGRARPSCLIAAEQYVNRGGHIVLHDSARAHYVRARDHLADLWKAEDIPDGVSQLTIWSRR